MKKLSIFCAYLSFPYFPDFVQQKFTVVVAQVRMRLVAMEPYTVVYELSQK